MSDTKTIETLNIPALKTSMKVMVVDDDRFLVNMYTIKFKRNGIDAVSAQNGTEALNKLRAGYNPDALIVDIVMPGMDGFEFIETVRREKLAEKSAVVFLTNQGQNPDLDRAKKLGVDSYIVKASTIPSEVVARIIDIIGKKK